MIPCRVNKCIAHAVLLGQFTAMEGPSTSCGLTCKKQIQYLDELLDQESQENVGESSSEEVDYSQTMPVETYESESVVARSESGNEQAV
jgi:hypothetical protein